MRKLLNTIATVLILLVILLALLIAGVRLVGLYTFPLLTDAMEPAYSSGALLYVKETDPAKLQPGDMITYMINQDSVETKQITAVVPDANDATTLRFQTKAAKESAPGSTLILDKNVIGVAVFSLPVLGYIANFIQTTPGTYVTIGVVILLLVCLFIPNRTGNKNSEATNQRNPRKNSGKYQGKFSK